MAILWRIHYSAGLALFLLLGKLTWADHVTASSPPVCPLESFKDSILGSHDSTCSVSGIRSFYTAGVIEGDEVTLQKALQVVHKNTNDYVALLFYASWCPFSGTFRSNFSALSSLFPSIPHFAIEESAVRPSILSKYGVHGLPTLFLLNSTMRVRYHGSRTLDSLISFYGNVTGTKTASVDGVCLDKIGCSLYQEEHKSDKEICPFPWARFPVNLLQQETCLALAILFVILRLLYFFFPTLRGCTQSAWRRCGVKLRSLWEHPVVYLNRAIPLYHSLKEPCKKSNLQEGAKNAKVWASKSLASVSFRDASSSRDLSDTGDPQDPHIQYNNCMKNVLLGEEQERPQEVTNNEDEDLVPLECQLNDSDDDVDDGDFRYQRNTPKRVVVSLNADFEFEAAGEDDGTELIFDGQPMF